MKADINEFEPKMRLRDFKYTRDREKNIIEYRLKKVEKWKKRLEVLKDSTIEKLVGERLEKLFDECVKQGLHFKKKISYDKQYTTSYVKDKVKIEELHSSLTIFPNGTVCMDVYRVPEESKRQYYFRPSAATKVIRIFVGDQVRITNNVLRSLMQKV